VTNPPTVITTDFFAFDDTDDSYGLREFDPKARAVEITGGTAINVIRCFPAISQVSAICPC